MNKVASHFNPVAQSPLLRTQLSLAAVPGVSLRSRHRDAFTLIEILLAVTIFSIVLVAIHTVFYGAIQLRNKTTQTIEERIPLQQALAVLKRDLLHIVMPGGTFMGELQTSTSFNSTTNALSTLNNMSLPTEAIPGQSGPAFYTASGIIRDEAPWGEIQRVYYYLGPPTNNTVGQDLIRSVTHNLLPILPEQPEIERLMGGVESITFLFYDGLQWRNYWDSTVESNKLPQGIKVQLQLVEEKSSRGLRSAPIELVCPVVLQALTNQVAQTSEGEQ